MAVGWPTKVSYLNGDVFSASDINDTNGTINLLGQSVAYTAGKNKVLNSAAQIWQRGTSIATTGAYTADRWLEVNNTNSITYTRSTDVPSSLGFQYSISRAGIGSNMTQRIEAANAAQLAGQTVTLSFYYKSTAGADSLGYSFYYANAADNFGAVTQIGSTQTIATPSTSWTRVSYTYTTISANAANGVALYIFRGSGATSTTLITGFQLEIGSTATAFQTATGTIQGELAACQRYYLRYSTPNTNYGLFASNSWAYATTTAVGFFSFPVEMRVIPTSMDTSTLAYSKFDNTHFALTSLVLETGISTNKIAYVYGNMTGGPAAGTVGYFGSNNSSSAYIGFSAEL
jgi:hypothetical protein